MSLFDAIRLGDERSFDRILAERDDFNLFLADRDGHTPLTMALFMGRTSFVQKLLSRKADVCFGPVANVLHYVGGHRRSGGTVSDVVMARTLVQHAKGRVGHLLLQRYGGDRWIPLQTVDRGTALHAYLLRLTQEHLANAPPESHLLMVSVDTASWSSPTLRAIVNRHGARRIGFEYDDAEHRVLERIAVPSTERKALKAALRSGHFVSSRKRYLGLQVEN